MNQILNNLLSRTVFCYYKSDDKNGKVQILENNNSLIYFKDMVLRTLCLI